MSAITNALTRNQEFSVSSNEKSGNGMTVGFDGNGVAIHFAHTEHNHNTLVSLNRKDAEQLATVLFKALAIQEKKFGSS